MSDNDKVKLTLTQRQYSLLSGLTNLGVHAERKNAAEGKTESERVRAFDRALELSLLHHSLSHKVSEGGCVE